MPIVLAGIQRPGVMHADFVDDRHLPRAETGWAQTQSSPQAGTAFQKRGAQLEKRIAGEHGHITSTNGV